MTSSATFVNTLKKLQYPQGKKLQVDGFDWLFDNEDALPFLAWFCGHGFPNNLLSSQEIRQYSALRSADTEILTGHQLESALEVASLTQEEDLTTEELEAEVSSLEEELSAVEKRKSVFIHHRNRLSVKNIALAPRVSKLGEVEYRAKRRNKGVKEQLGSTCTGLNSSLDDLVKSTSDVISLYSSPSLPGAPFLSRARLQQYHSAEDRFTQELKVFTKKQFFEGIADLAGDRQREEFRLLNMSDPEILLVKGQGPRVWEEEFHELDRLRSLYPQSQKAKIKALVEAKRTEVAIRYAEEFLHTTQDIYPDNTNALSDRLQDVHSELHQLKQASQQLWQDVFPELLRATAEQQTTEVLYGDYNLKITRQNYVTAKQETLIRQLVVQRARNYFLGMSYEAESQGHQQVRRELSTMEQILQGYHSEHEMRMSLMSDSCLVVPKSPRNTVNSRDVFILRLSDVMRTNSQVENQQLFLTFADVLESASQLTAGLDRLRGELRDRTLAQQRTIAALEHHMRSCEAAVYDRTALPERQVLLTPPPIQNGITQLEKMIGNMGELIQEIMKEYSTKVKVLKGDPLEARQRQLFIHFFTDAAQLRRELKSVTDRIQALSVT